MFTTLRARGEISSKVRPNFSLEFQLYRLVQISGRVAGPAYLCLLSEKTFHWPHVLNSSIRSERFALSRTLRLFELHFSLLLDLPADGVAHPRTSECNIPEFVLPGY